MSAPVGMGGRAGPPLRNASALVPELLEALKAEYEGLLKDVATLRAERDEAERRNQMFLSDAQQLQAHVFALERALEAMRAQYEEELKRLRLGAPANPNAPALAPKPLGLPNAPALPGAPGAPAPSAPGAPGAPGQPRPQQSEWLVGYNPSVARRLNVKLEHTLDHAHSVTALRFTRDGRFLASATHRQAHLYDAATGHRLHVLPAAPPSTPSQAPAGAEEGAYVRALAFAPDGRTLATGGAGGGVQLWNTETGAAGQVLTGHVGDVYALDWSGSLVASGSADRTVRLWRDTEAVRSWGGFQDSVTSLAFSPDGLHVAAGSLDRTVRVFNVESGEQVAQLQEHEEAVYALAFAPDGRLATGSMDRSIKLWDLRQAQSTQTLQGHRDYVLALSFTSEGEWLVSGSKDRSLQVWEARQGVAHMILQGHRNSVLAVATAPHAGSPGGKFASGSGDSRACIWDFQTGQFGAAPATTS